MACTDRGVEGSLLYTVQLLQCWPLNRLRGYAIGISSLPLTHEKCISLSKGVDEPRWQ